MLIVPNAATVYPNMLGLKMTWELFVLLVKKQVSPIRGILLFRCHYQIIIIINIPRCPNDCNNNGNCTFIDLNTGEDINSCNVLSNTCNSKCVCANGILSSSTLKLKFLITISLIGMTGSACDTSIAQLKEVQSKQQDLLEQILR